MHPNPAFRAAPTDLNLRFAAARGFGVLSINGEGGPLAAHVPFVVEGEAVCTHLARSNPILRALGGPVPALLAVSGPEGYVSPDWYGAADQVPTWNYVAVHLRGMLGRRPEDELRPHLERLSAAFEARLLPKRPWTHGKMGAGVMDRMERMIVPVRLDLTGVEGTWKLNQNKPDAVRASAADGVEGAGNAALAALMRMPPA